MSYCSNGHWNSVLLPKKKCSLLALLTAIVPREETLQPCHHLAHTLPKTSLPIWTHSSKLLSEVTLFSTWGVVGYKHLQYTAYIVYFYFFFVLDFCYQWYLHQIVFTIWFILRQSTEPPQGEASKDFIWGCHPKAIVHSTALTAVMKNIQT